MAVTCTERDGPENILDWCLTTQQDTRDMFRVLDEDELFSLLSVLVSSLKMSRRGPFIDPNVLRNPRHARRLRLGGFLKTFIDSMIEHQR